MLVLFCTSPSTYSFGSSFSGLATHFDGVFTDIWKTIHVFLVSTNGPLNFIARGISQAKCCTTKPKGQNRPQFSHVVRSDPLYKGKPLGWGHVFGVSFLKATDGDSIRCQFRHHSSSLTAKLTSLASSTRGPGSQRQAKQVHLFYCLLFAQKPTGKMKVKKNRSLETGWLLGTST